MGGGALEEIYREFKRGSTVLTWVWWGQNLWFRGFCQTRPGGFSERDEVFGIVLFVNEL